MNVPYENLKFNPKIKVYKSSIFLNNIYAGFIPIQDLLKIRVFSEFKHRKYTIENRNVKTTFIENCNSKESNI